METPVLAAVGTQLSEAAADYVRGMIMSGELRPGDLVQPGSIGIELGISATPAREALKALRVEGFLELLPRRGFQVAPLNAEDIRDLFSMYALVAGELAARAAVRATPADLEVLESIHVALVAAAGRSDHHLVDEKNDAFHRLISNCGGSRKISWVVSLIERYMPHSFNPPIDGWLEVTLHDHLEILDALNTHDAEATRRTMHDHLVRAGDLLAKQFDKRTHSASGGSVANGHVK